MRALCAVVFVVLPLLAGAQTTWQQARERGFATLQVHCNFDPPFVFAQPKGTWAGIEYDLLLGFKEHVKRIYGVELTLEMLPYEDGYGVMFPRLAQENENAVGLGGISIHASREASFDFTLPYLADIDLLFSSEDIPILPPGADSSYKEHFKNCIGLTGAKSTGVESFRILRDQYLPDLQIDSSFKNAVSSFEAVKVRRRVLTYIALPLYLYRFDEFAEVHRQRVFMVVRKGLAIMLPEGSSWKAPLDEYITQVQATGRINDLVYRYLGEDKTRLFNDISQEIQNGSRSDLILTFREQEAFKENLAVAEEKSQRRLLVAWLAGFLVLLSVAFSVGLVRQSRYRKRVTETLQTQKDEIERQHHALEQANAELIAMQEEVLRTEKLALLGTLVNNVAHQVNSPVAAIRSSGTFLQRHIAPSARKLVEAGVELTTETHDAFLALLISKTGARAEYQSMGPRERRKLRQQLIESLPERLLPEADQVADSLLTMGIRVHGEIPEQMQGKYRTAWAAYADIARLLVSVDNILAAADRASRFVQLLKFFIAETPAISREAVAVAPVLARILAQYSGSVSAGIRLETSLDEAAVCHLPSEWLAVILEQPVLNAIQAMRNEGTFTVSLTQTATGAKVVYEDTGPGIGQEILQNLFQPFVSTKQQGEGVGLGLYLVKRSLEAVGGAITLDSNKPGVRVTLEIP